MLEPLHIVSLARGWARGTRDREEWLSYTRCQEPGAFGEQRAADGHQKGHVGRRQDTKEGPRHARRLGQVVTPVIGKGEQGSEARPYFPDTDSVPSLPALAL